MRDHDDGGNARRRRQADRGILGETDFHLLGEGTHAKLYEKLGAHAAWDGEGPGTRFAVWAPNAETIDVVGDWTDWQPGRVPLRAVGGSGVWQGFAAGVGPGHKYKFRIRSRYGGYSVNKADPFAFASEVPPATASVITSLDEYTWGDLDWMVSRLERNALASPMSMYEVHLGSWMRSLAPYGTADLPRARASAC